MSARNKSLLSIPHLKRLDGNYHVREWKNKMPKYYELPTKEIVCETLNKLNMKIEQRERERIRKIKYKNTHEKRNQIQLLFFRETLQENFLIKISWRYFFIYCLLPSKLFSVRPGIGHCNTEKEDGVFCQKNSRETRRAPEGQNN